jgi:septal ring factor EnvC (AmiA/AmiB activator)
MVVTISFFQSESLANFAHFHSRPELQEIFGPNLERLRQEVRRKKLTIFGLQIENRNLRAHIADMETQLAQIQHMQTKLQTCNDHIHQQIASLNEQIEELQRQESDQNKTITYLRNALLDKDLQINALEEEQERAIQICKNIIDDLVDRNSAEKNKLQREVERLQLQILQQEQ